MPDPGVYAFSIRKSRLWRGKTQGFSNLYHYDMVTPSVADLEAVLDALKAAETPVHASTVTFVEGRSWGPVNSNGRGGRMEAVKAFTGNGGATSTANMYREAAFLLSWPLGRYGSKNRPQFLRKWLHSDFMAQGGTSGLDGNTALGAITTPLSTYAAAVRTLTGAGIAAPLALIPASNHPTIGAAVLFPFLEHRQFG